MARRDIGPRTMTNSEMQDRTTTNVIGKAAGRDQHHSVGSCCVATAARPVSSRWSGFTATTNALAATGETLLHVRGPSERCNHTGSPLLNDRGAVRWYPLTSAEALRERCRR